MALNNDVKMINQVLSFCTYMDQSISGIFEVIIFETDANMDVRNQIWNVTSRMALIVC